MAIVTSKEGRATREGAEGRYWRRRLRKEQKVRVSGREGEGRKRKKRGGEAE